MFSELRPPQRLGRHIAVGPGGGVRHKIGELRHPCEVDGKAGGTDEEVGPRHRPVRAQRQGDALARRALRRCAPAGRDADVKPGWRSARCTLSCGGGAGLSCR